MSLIKTLLTSGDYTTSRVEAFSDGVFAIIVTLLVLELSLPVITHADNQHVWQAIKSTGPKIFLYVISFLNIAVYWINHHQLFSVLRKTDRGMLWLNCILLLILAFVPFPTSVLGSYPHQIISVILFGGVMILAALCFGTMRYYSTYYSCLMQCGKVDKDALRKSVIKSYSGAFFYIIAIALGFISTTISIVLFFLIPLSFALPSRLERELDKE